MRTVNRSNVFVASACALFLIALSVEGEQATGAADLILHNGVIWTVDSKNSIAQAVAIREGKFIAVGADREVMKLRGPRTEVIDLRGRFVTPGFNDNHVHFQQAAQFLEFNIMATNTQEEFIRRVREVVRSLAKGEWILGGYWGAYDQWEAGSAGGRGRQPFVPDMKLIAEITRDHPVFIRKFDDSEFAANLTALKAVGIDLNDPQATDVEFVKDGAGRATGILRGRGVTKLFASVLPRRFSHERRVQQTKNALAEIRKYGVTNVSDMSDDEQLEIYRQLHLAGELTVRVHFRPGLDRWKEMGERSVRIGSGVTGSERAPSRATSMASWGRALLGSSSPICRTQGIAGGGDL
jgi:hypothetical protein